MDSVVAASSTHVETLSDPQQTLVLRLKKKEYPHVTWAKNVVDNEGLGRLKSNCCCIYVPPRDFDDPATWVPDECETAHCRGHTLAPPKPKN
ncbi:hypothetical protein PMAYCL1PPCAC_18531 [Pristionchus mayeri]|uniref:E3 ubiquitin-protein ligase PPP1R11 n=1 Tax=Pristionchus mayeri TaxID=1317129 RepID=A0AAN5CPK2_9BILA|nr:hypothetical protein PMAYCL1PPCAC_18531 [Pristionchus mayeri]